MICYYAEKRNLLAEQLRGLTIKLANRHRVLVVAAMDKNLSRFDDVDISAFHSCVIVDLWQSLSEWHLLLSACVLLCRRENVGA